MQLIAFLITLTILVFIHELGHYVIARRHGVRVDVFSIGFGPALFKRQFWNTEWRISLIPLGGYIRMNGQYVPQVENKSEPPAEDALEAKSLWQRSQIVLAGPVANILLAIALFWVLIAIQGVPQPGVFSRDGLGSVVPDSPADRAGLLAGDILVDANNQPVDNIQDLANYIQESEGNPISFGLVREGQNLELFVTPEFDKTTNRYRIGVGDAVIWKDVGLFPALYIAGERTLDFSLLIIRGIANLVTGSGLDQVGGPIQIASIANHALQSGWDTFASFLAIFSINLALLNMLPIPGLDGGYLLNYGITAIFGNRVGNAAMRYSLPVGIVFLVTLMVLIISVDLLRLFGSP